eukprot:7023177-Alexandrium_andersonii.AAC.1
MLAEVPAAQADASGQDAAQLLVVHVQRQAGAGGIGGQITCRREPAEPPQTHIEFVLFVAETGTAWAAADPSFGDRALRGLLAAGSGRRSR